MGRLDFMLATAPKHDGELKLWVGGDRTITATAAISSDGNLDAGTMRLPKS